MDGYLGRRPNVSKDPVVGADAKRLLKLQKSRSGHQGHMTHLNSKISVLLYDIENVDAVKELKEMFMRQWERFNLLHEEILMLAEGDTSIKSNALRVFEEQSTKKSELLDKVSRYLNAEPAVRFESSEREKSCEGEFETRSNASISSSNSVRSARSIASLKSLETRMKREKAELSLKQLRARQHFEKEAELKRLELQYAAEQQKLNDEIELAKLEEWYAVEEERKLYLDRLNVDQESKFEYRAGPLPKAMPLDAREKLNLDGTKQRVISDREFSELKTNIGSVNTIQQLADAFANLSHAPPIEITKFTGDPKDYLRFSMRFRDQVLSQPISESKKLSRLMQYLAGTAKEAVEQYEGMGVGALEEALSVLEIRFGQPYMIIDAFITSIVKGPNISAGDGKSLQRLADTCQSVLKTLEIMKSLHEINTDHMRRVVARLPYYNQSKWRDRASAILRRCGSVPTFKDLTEFLRERAQSENNPLYGNLRDPERQKKTEKRKKEEHISTYTTQFGPECHNAPSQKQTPSCIFCQGHHNLQACKKFLSMSTVKRRKLVLEKKLCFQCLSTGHYKRFCKGSRCQVRNCNRRHHNLLHLDGSRDQGTSTEQENSRTTPAVKRDADVQTLAANVLPQLFRGTIALPVVAVKVLGADGQEATTYALLDQASEASFVLTSLAKRLHLKGSRGALSVKSLTGTASVQAEKVNLTLESTSRAGTRLLARDVIITDKLDVQLKVAPTRANGQTWEHLSDIEFPEVELEKILILIGADNPEVFMTEEIRIGNAEQPWGFKYKLGWALMGPTSQAQTNQVNVNLLQSTTPNIEEMTLKEQVNRFFLDDGLGVVTNTKKAMSVQDTKAKKMMEESTAIVDGHYEIGMLWNNDPHLPNNRDVAFRRLGYLRTRLEKDKELHKKYQAKIEEYVEKGYASKLQPAEIRRVSDRIWYLPHHPVFHPAKPGKVRIVFDAASRFKGTSLNDKLLHGPNLSNEIIEVLLRFRKEEIAIAADIQEMFHQVKVPPRDRDCLRFLWSPHDLDDCPEEYRMNVHIFGAKDSPSVANYALKRTAKDNSYAFSQEAVHAVEKDFYVDDLLKSLPNEEEAMRIANEVKELLKRGGFRLTKWASSSKRVLASIPESERAHPTLNLDLDDLPMQRALGLWWNVKEDAFEFKVDDLDKPETKRGILSVIASLYDPLGFAAPVALSAKSLLQRLWRKKADWDDKLAEAELKEWQQWKRALPDLSRVKISRCYKTSGPAKEVKTGAVKYVEDVQLHNFSDASEIGYGTVSYIRTKFTNGTVLCSLAFGKSRSAPLRRISTPRLELQAAVLSIRISEIIQREIERTFSKVCYWTDSEVVLKYIKNEDKRFTVYVGNRVAEIREKSQVQQWRYCPSKDNPADDASRGLRPSELTPTCRWLNGPSFLQKSEAYWPQTAPKRITENDPEIFENIQTNVVVRERERQPCMSFWQDIPHGISSKPRLSG